MTPDLEEELTNCDWFVAKVRNSKTYAKDVYAALCNMQWQKQEIVPVLKDDFWSCTWRYAGGFVANIENQGGDYMDWYCAGGEGFVTDEIKEDLARLGWVPIEWDDDFV